jgi:hypothetical protein
MKTTTWIALIGLLALAGIADAGTFILTPVAVRAYDLSPIARAWTDFPLGLFAYKLALPAAFVAVIPIARYVGIWMERFAAVAVVTGTILWTAGTWSNVAWGWH